MPTMAEVSRSFGVSEAQARETEAALRAEGLDWGDLIKFGPCIAAAIGCVIANPQNAAQCGVAFVGCIADKVGGGARARNA